MLIQIHWEQPVLVLAKLYKNIEPIFNSLQLINLQLTTQYSRMIEPYPRKRPILQHLGKILLSPISKAGSQHYRSSISPLPHRIWLSLKGILFQNKNLKIVKKAPI